MNPVLTIIDAITVMDGPGPIRGRARPLGWLIGSTDPIACETICARLIGMEPESLPIVKTAMEINKEKGEDHKNFCRADFDKIKISGDEFPEYICSDFQSAKLIPIRFSFLRVCKSISKQIWLIFDEAIHKNRYNK